MEQETKKQKIYIIGNNKGSQDIADGGRIKVRLYIQILQREGFDVETIDLHNWKKRIFKLIGSIRKAVKEKANIVIMGGPKGCRVIIPMVCFLNKKNEARVMFCPLGIGTLDKLLKKLSVGQVNSFLACENFYGIKDKKMGKHLSKMAYVVLENEKLQNTYVSFYSLKNTAVLTNFRDVSLKPKEYSTNEKELRIVFLSRVNKTKGIFDLIDAVKRIRTNYSYNLYLDIYGELNFNDSEVEAFNSSLTSEIRYWGVAQTSHVVDILKKYDLFCLPTTYYGEGTPGAIVESMIAGTPVLTSSFEQVASLIKDKEDGLIFEINNNSDLEDKIIYIYKNKLSVLPYIGKNGQKTASKFTYENNRDLFLEVMGGSVLKD